MSINPSNQSPTTGPTNSLTQEPPCNEGHINISNAIVSFHTLVCQSVCRPNCGAKTYIYGAFTEQFEPTCVAGVYKSKFLVGTPLVAR